MSDIAVRVEDLGKCYQIGQAKSGDLRESFGSWMDKLRGRSNGNEQQAESKEFWALKDINFEIKKGEAVGIIGRNGAGKSTLLKILSRITEPTRGRFEINGRVSSLLEVGTGFHPELSGRENIYLNGTILGMKRREIKAKFDEIVAFSGVEKFIDTPVKHYSSGMKVRLAFSVAAHLEPEILIIDEVLAVGDAEFQKKCLGKMDEVSKNDGRTVIFVSHNMGAIQSLCRSALLLEKGRKVEQSNVSFVIQKYFQEAKSKEKQTFEKFSTEMEGLVLLTVSVRAADKGFNKDIIVRISLGSDGEHKGLSLGIGLCNSLSVRLITTERRIDLLKGKNTFDIRIRNPFLPPGNCSLSLGLDIFGRNIFYKDDIVNLEITEEGVANDFLVQKGNRIGLFLPNTLEKVYDEYEKLNSNNHDK